MEFLDAGRVVDATPWGELIDAIGAELAAGNSVAPQRHVHDVPMVDGSTGALLLMPAWTAGELIATKVVTFFPSNAGTVVPTVNAAVLLFDGRDGRHVATIDGDELTARRTAAISAEPNAALHLYGKSEVKPGRKMGHVNRVVSPGG